MAQYNFTDSLKRINDMIGFNPNDNKLPFVPRLEEITENKSYSVNVTVMLIKVDASVVVRDNTLSKRNLSVNSFLSELTAVCQSNENCRDIIITLSSVMVVYSTPKKVDVDSVIDDAARIRSLAMVIHKLDEKISIKTTFAIDYGQVIMNAIVTSPTQKRYVWTGGPVEEVQKMIDKATQGQGILSDVIWKNINQDNQKLFKGDSISGPYYKGNVVNILINNWLLSKD